MSRWFLYTVLTMLLWGGWGVLSKPLSEALSSWQVQTLSTLGLLPVLALLAGAARLSHSANPRLGCAQAFGSGIITSLGNVACYEALAAGGKAAAVIPLTGLYPLVTILLALVVLRERLNTKQAAGVGASLVALYCFSGGVSAGFMSAWLAVAFLAVVLWGTGAFLQKLATLHASSELATLAFLLGFLPVAVLTPLFHPISLAVGVRNWALVLALGLFFALGNLTLMRAYSLGGRAAIVTPMASLYSLVTIPAAVVLLGERPTLREGCGIACALLAVVGLSWETPTPPTQPLTPQAAPQQSVTPPTPS
jgi:drug/metabolite transporter (DMT)-like permease